MEMHQSRLATLRKTLSSWAGAAAIYQHEDKVLLLLTLIIAAVVGLVVVAFILLTENLGSRMYPAGGAAWRRVVIPVLGALITGVLLQRYFPNARGSGIPQTKTALFLHGGFIRFRTAVGKFVCSCLSLASGIALGREGPSVQVGAGIASSLGRRLGFSPDRVRSLVPVGAAAALAAAFNTPIAAVLFTLEEVVGDLHARALGAVVLSSATSWMVLHLVLGDEPLFHVPAYQLVHPIEFAFYALLGVAGGLVSVSFVKLLLWLRDRFLRLPEWTGWVQPAAGGLLVGVLGWFAPDVLGVGYNHVSQALNGQLALYMMALLVALKLISTAACYASGNAGGIFGPSLFIGAMMGGAIGGSVHGLLPDYTGSTGAYALVGMGAAFAGIIRAPLTSVIMIFEVTRDYSIIVPLMLANLISYLVSSRMQPVPVYEALLHQDHIHLPTAARDREDVCIVEDGLSRSPEVLHAEDNVERTLATVNRERSAWPVVGPDGLAGMITAAQLEQAANEGRGGATLGDLLPPEPHPEGAGEIYPHVHADQPLDSAMRRLSLSGLPVLPVVSRANVRELVGTISLPDALAAYAQEKDRNPAPEPPRKRGRTPVAVLGGVLAVLVAAVGLAAFLSYYYRAERGARALRFFSEGNALMAKERFQDAVERYRAALSISHSTEHRLALALALVEAGRFNEAEIYLRELLSSDPHNGPANLGRARIAAQRGDARQALHHYHQAIYGAWPSEPEAHRFQTRVALVRTLGNFGEKQQAQAELLLLLAEMPEDVAVRRRVGRLLLDFDLPKEAAGVFRQLIQKNRQDAEAHAGLGDAEFSQERYRSARDSFREALRRNPAHARARARLDVTEQILALDPAMRGLRGTERYERSRKLVEITSAALAQCLPTKEGPPPASVSDLTSAANSTLQSRRRPRSYTDAAEENTALAARLWETRLTFCRPPGPLEEPVANIMERLSR